MPPIYRTVFQIEVLSAGPYAPDGGEGDPFDLATINYDITEGECIGQVTILRIEPVPAEAVTEALLALGNDGSFFATDEDQ